MANAQCYAKFNNTIIKSTWKPCGRTNTTSPYVPCCEDGDSCMTNGLCRYSQSEVGGSGFYAGGCTDSSFNGKQCPQLCNDLGLRDVVFENRQRRWACCGSVNGTRTCDNPTKQSFDAPRPNELQSYFTVGDRQPQPHDRPENRVSISSAPVNLPTAITTPTSTPTPAAKSHGLPAAAIGGIGAAVAIGALAVIGVLIFLCFKKKKKTKEIETQSSSQHFVSPQMSNAYSRPWTATNTTDPPPVYPSITSTPASRNEPFQQHPPPTPQQSQQLYQPSPIQPQQHIQSPIPQSIPQSTILEATPMELGSGKGGGHPLNDQSRGGLPMRHELPTDNEIRPSGVMSPLSPIEDMSPIAPLRPVKSINQEKP